MVVDDDDAVTGAATDGEEVTGDAEWCGSMIVRDVAAIDVAAIDVIDVDVAAVLLMLLSAVLQQRYSFPFH